MEYLDCRNLLGDTLYLIKPLRRYLEKSKHEITLIVGGGFQEEMIRLAFPNVPITAQDMGYRSLGSGPAGKKAEPGKLHITDGYAELLGLERCADDHVASVDWLPDLVKKPKPCRSVLSPFSPSCSRNRGEVANKTIDEVSWLPIVDLLEDKLHLPVEVVCAANEHFSKCRALRELKHYSATTLAELQRFLLEAAVIVTVENGIQHLASALGCNVIDLWPAVSRKSFIAPDWNKTTVFIDIGNPVTVTAEKLYEGCKGALSRLGLL